MKYIDADKLIAEIERRKGYISVTHFAEELLDFLDSLQQEKQIPNSTQLIAEWEKEKAVLEQKDFRGDAERMAYNAFLDGFVKGLGYESTK